MCPSNSHPHTCMPTCQPLHVCLSQCVWYERLTTLQWLYAPCDAGCSEIMPSGGDGTQCTEHYRHNRAAAMSDWSQDGAMTDHLLLYAKTRIIRVTKCTFRFQTYFQVDVLACQDADRPACLYDIITSKTKCYVVSRLSEFSKFWNSHCFSKAMSQ